MLTSICSLLRFLILWGTSKQSPSLSFASSEKSITPGITVDNTYPWISKRKTSKDCVSLGWLPAASLTARLLDSSLLCSVYCRNPLAGALWACDAWVTEGGLGDAPSEQVALSGGRQSEAAAAKWQWQRMDQKPMNKAKRLKSVPLFRGKCWEFLRGVVIGTDFFKTEHSYCRVGFGFLWGQSVLGSPKRGLEDVR